MTNEVQGVAANVQAMLSDSSGWLATLEELLTKFGLRIIAAIVIFIIGRWIAKLLRDFIRKIMERAKIDAAITAFVASLVHAGMMVFVILAALSQLGVETTSFIAMLGAAGLAVGLALQGSLSNFASGVLILLFRPFKAGDYIEGGDANGIVKEIHIFTTTLTTLDNKRVIIPNSKITENNIINYSSEGVRRIDLVACISYSDDIDTAKAAMLDLISNHPLVLKDPAPMVGVLAMNNSSIDLAVRPWVKVPDYWTAFFALNEAIKKRLEAAGCTIPFPQRDVHLYKHDT